jgi:hypothetical protein
MDNPALAILSIWDKNAENGLHAEGRSVPYFI